MALLVRDIGTCVIILHVAIEKKERSRWLVPLHFCRVAKGIKYFPSKGGSVGLKFEEGHTLWPMLSSNQVLLPNGDSR